jgi:hypothetical protein
MDKTIINEEPVEVTAQIGRPDRKKQERTPVSKVIPILAPGAASIVIDRSQKIFVRPRPRRRQLSRGTSIF